MIFDYLLSIIIKSITSPNITQFSSHIPESPSKLNSLWWSVLLSSQKWKISFAPWNLFNSRINNRALLLQRLLFIFCSCWRRLLLKDRLFICLFVESLLLLSLSIFPIMIFFVTVVAMITIFISSSFISPSLVLLLVVFLFFFFHFFFFFFILIQKIQCESCGYSSCWLPTIVRFLSHGKFWVWRWRMDASHEDWRQKGAYFC